ncbi:hypothetical protein BCR32DRAFT_267661 [Anaeromyces robustus]|uniref:Ankyrin n=1 Tax=Anaeromyces robustus TaxID=1754192 RepID=A0A1Y1X9K7_9FUNG|nr:hypothetical protein BCR32DRAFT_267661 [Anaeromyces robustus]|eukprot:ORX82440.1 hypothetical protein BCR32DRAFT_267661 [Anaeromyces robustus]
MSETNEIIEKFITIIQKNHVTLLEKFITIIQKNNVSLLEKFLRDNKYKLKNFKGQDFDLLVIAIQNNISQELLQCIIDIGEYKDLNYSKRFKYYSPLYYAIKEENFSIADFLLEFHANIDYKDDDHYFNLLQSLYRSNNLTIKSLKYLIRHGATVTSKFINKLINKKENTYLRIIFDESLCYQNIILKLLFYYHQKIGISSSDLETIITNKDSKIIINKNIYKEAICHENYIALKHIYDYDIHIRDLNDILYDIFEAFDKKGFAGKDWTSKKFQFINLIESGILSINIDPIFLNHLEHIEEERMILLPLIISNRFLEFEYFIKDRHFYIPFFNTETMDMLITAIENNVSLPMINYICCHYRSLNYVTISCSPLSTALAQNKFQIADILIRHGANINFEIGRMNLFKYLQYYNILNTKNLNYLLRKCSCVKEISNNYINNLIQQSNYNCLEMIFKYYIYNDAFILNLLSYYKNYHALSKKQLQDMVNQEINKINFTPSQYIDAVESENYKLLDIYYRYDTRNKLKVLYNILHAFEKDDLNHENSNKKFIFIEKVKNHQICFSFPIYFLDIIANYDKKRNKINDLIGKNQYYELMQFLKNEHIIPFYFKNSIFDILILSIDHEAPLDFIEYLVSTPYYQFNYTINNYQSPLYMALSHNNFQIANLLLEKGATLNYPLSDDKDDITQCLYKQNKLNFKNLYYILHHYSTITDALFIEYIRNIQNNTFLIPIFKYYYHCQNVNHFINYSKGNIPLSNEGIRKLLLEELPNNNNNKELNFDFYNEAISTTNLKLLLTFLNYDARELSQYLDTHRCKTFSLAIEYGNRDLIDKMFSCQNYNYFNDLDFYSIICLDRKVNKRENIRTIKYFIKKLFEYENFDLAKNYIQTLFEAIKRCHKDVDIIKYIIKKFTCHPTFNLQTLPIYNIVNGALPLLQENYLYEYYIKKCFRRKIINLNNTNVRIFYDVLDSLMNCVSYFKNLEQIMYVLRIFFKHPSFNLQKNVNFNECVEILQRYMSRDLKPVIHYFFCQFCIHPTFNYHEINLDKLLYLMRILEFDEDEIQEILECIFNHESFQFQKTNFIEVLYQLNELYSKNISNTIIGLKNISKYVIDQTISHSSFNAEENDYIEYLRYLLDIKKNFNFFLFGYLKYKIFNQSNINLNLIPYQSLIQNYHWNDIYIMELLIMEHLHPKNNTYDEKLIKKIFQYLIQYHRTYLLKTMIEVFIDHPLFNLIDLDIPFEKVLLDDMKNGYIYEWKYIFNLLLNYKKENEENEDKAEEAEEKEKAKAKEEEINDKNGIYFTFHNIHLDLNYYDHYNHPSNNDENELLINNSNEKIQIIDIEKLLLKANELHHILLKFY